MGALFRLRCSKIRALNQLVDDGSDKEILLDKEINFIESMTFTKAQAIQDPICRQHCRNSFLEAWDRGRLTLVNPKFFDFGVEVVTLVATNFSMRKMKTDIDMATSANKDIMEDQPLWDMFLETSKDFTHLNKRWKKKVCLEILLKVKNVTSCDVINVFRQENTVRGSKNKETQLALHQDLDSMSAAAKKKSKENKKSG